MFLISFLVIFVYFACTVHSPARRGIFGNTNEDCQAREADTSFSLWIWLMFSSCSLSAVRTSKHSFRLCNRVLCKYFLILLRCERASLWWRCAADTHSYGERHFLTTSRPISVIHNIIHIINISLRAIKKVQQSFYHANDPLE